MQQQKKPRSRNSSKSIGTTTPKCLQKTSSPLTYIRRSTKAHKCSYLHQRIMCEVIYYACERCPFDTPTKEIARCGLADGKGGYNIYGCPNNCFKIRDDEHCRCLTEREGWAIKKKNARKETKEGKTLRGFWRKLFLSVSKLFLPWEPPKIKMVFRTLQELGHEKSVQLIDSELIPCV